MEIEIRSLESGSGVWKSNVRVWKSPAWDRKSIPRGFSNVPLGRHKYKPDSVTRRGARHLVELGDMVEAGNRGVMCYLVQRGDCGRFAIAGDIDPTYARELERAIARGVEAICYACTIDSRGIEVRTALRLEL